jgi:O-antigen/teichoic acid export membrane protein
MLGSIILLLAILGMGAEALLYAIMIADICAILLIEGSVGVYRRVKIRVFDMGQVKSMCAYSIPLLPNAVVLVFLPFLCRYVIISTMGTDASGIFGLSAKFPSLLAAVLSIFGLAWQESAITEYDSDHRDQYYSKTFNLYVRLLLSALMLLLSVTRGMTLILIGEEFSEAWRYIPFLYIGIIFAAFAQFYGTGYLSSKKTLGAFITTLTGVVCGSVCLFFVPEYGIQAAALTQMTAYLLMFLTRVVHTRRFFRIRVDLPVFFFLAALAGGFTYGYFLADPRVEIVMLGVSTVIFFIFNRELIRRILNLAANTLRKRSGSA